MDELHLESLHLNQKEETTTPPPPPLPPAFHEASEYVTDLLRFYAISEVDLVRSLDAAEHVRHSLVELIKGGVDNKIPVRTGHSGVHDIFKTGERGYFPINEITADGLRDCALKVLEAIRTATSEVKCIWVKPLTIEMEVISGEVSISSTITIVYS